MISELHTKKGTWKIAVQITDMWHVNKHNGKQAIEMVFMDQTGAKIGATLWQEPFPEFEEVERPEIPTNVHVITPFANIIDGVVPRDTLVDVVGVVVEVIERKTVNPTYRVTIKLRDNNYSDRDMILTGCEEYALPLDDAIEKNHFDRKPLVVMLTLAKIKDPKGEISRLRQSGDDIKVFPPCVDELLGKTWAVRFKYRVQMHQSSVLDVTEDEDLIQTMTSTIAL
ncbi:hypothetical protein JHK82_022820 [Glycine max]|nr:hypothetical protein JHK82_022820 [Glycine max]